MHKQFLSSLLALVLMVVSTGAAACANHIYLDPNQFGIIGRTAIKLSGLAPPEPVFKIKHPSMAKVGLGEESELVIEYDRPWRSDNVTMKISSTKGIDLQVDTVELEELDGVIKVPFSLVKAGYNSITIKVTGEHKGEEVTNASVVYIRPKPKPVTEEKGLLAES